MEERVARTVAERTSLAEGLRELGVGFADSQANFCWVHLGDSDEADVMQGLLDRGVLVRSGTALGSATPALRVTFGLADENERFLAALSEVLAPAPTR